jgi:hypothetical protein
VGAPSPSTPTKIIKSLNAENEELKKKVKSTAQKYRNRRRRNLRLEKAVAGRKVDLKQAKINAARMRGVDKSTILCGCALTKQPQPFADGAPLHN